MQAKAICKSHNGPQTLLLHGARLRVAGQMRDADALQGKIDAMGAEVARARTETLSTPKHKPFPFSAF